MKKSIKILYVEDELMVQENTKRPLSYMCDELFVAKDGVEGLELYKKHLPDIVVSDIKMPNLNGIEMVKEIKKINKKQHVVFTTAHSESNYFIEAIEMQADGYILKPLDYDLLEEKISSIIHQINLQYKLQQQEIIINEISKLQNNLLVVLDFQQNIIFANNQFLDFFNLTTISDFKKSFESFNKIFIKESLFNNENWIDELTHFEHDKKIVKLLNIKEHQEQTFFISLSTINHTKHIIITFTEITDLTQEVDNFKDKAFRDELTQIYNRAYFNKELDEKLATTNKEPISLLFFDIDKFKNFNDTYGHQTGDTILKELALLVNKHIRQTDTLARWGGEEFIIILPNSDINIAYKVAQNLRQIIQEHNFADNLNVTCSFGVAQYKDGEKCDELIKKVDTALYKAKENGRNRVERCNK